MKQSNENKPVLDQQVIQVSEALVKTPQVLNSLLWDLPEPWTHATEGADTWSPLEVVGHLIWGELVQSSLNNISNQAMVCVLTNHLK